MFCALIEQIKSYHTNARKFVIRFKWTTISMTDLTPVKIMLKYKTEMEGHFGHYDSLLKLNQKGQKYVLLLRKL